jgi:CysZ protein
VFSAFFKALGQLGDPAISKIVGIAIALAVAVFAGIAILAWFLVGLMAGLPGWWGEAAQIGGVFVTMVVAWFTFPALAAAFSAIFADQVIDAVEAKYYPNRPKARQTPFWEAAADGLKLAGLSLLVNLLTLPLLVFFPLYVVVAYGLNGYLLGREYFEMPAFRRLSRPEAKAVFGQNRGRFVGGGIVIAFLSTLPIVNLIAPIIATAFMVHLFESVVNHVPTRGVTTVRP